MKGTSLMNPVSTERWRDVPGWEGLYKVSDQGRVMSLHPRWANWPGGGRVTPGSPNNTRAMTVRLHRGGVGLTVNVHTLVLTAFVGPRPSELTCCCHNDGNPQNNRLANLRWDTYSANSLDSVRHGTCHGTAKTACKHGHPFDEANTMWQTKGGRLHRRCKACNRKRNRESKHRRKVAAS